MTEQFFYFLSLGRGLNCVHRGCGSKLIAIHYFIIFRPGVDVRREIINTLLLKGYRAVTRMQDILNKQAPLWQCIRICCYAARSRSMKMTGTIIVLMWVLSGCSVMTKDMDGPSPVLWKITRR